MLSFLHFYAMIPFYPLGYLFRQLVSSLPHLSHLLDISNFVIAVWQSMSCRKRRVNFEILAQSIVMGDPLQNPKFKSDHQRAAEMLRICGSEHWASSYLYINRIELFMVVLAITCLAPVLLIGCLGDGIALKWPAGFLLFPRHRKGSQQASV